MSQHRTLLLPRVLKHTTPILAFCFLVANTPAVNGQPEGFVEEFSGPGLDPVWSQIGNPASHPASINGTYNVTHAHSDPAGGTKLNRSIAGSVGSFTHAIDLVLDPHLLSGGGGTRTDFKWKSGGSDGVLEVVYNSFGDLRVNHFDFNTGNGDHIAGGSPDNINIGYVDGDALKLAIDYDSAMDTIDVTYALNGGLATSVYSGGGIDGAFGDVITNFVEVEIFKFGDATLDQTVAAIDRWSLSSESVAISGDANGDGNVDLLDLDILGANFGAMGGATFADGDFNGDGNVDLLDLDILGGNFGASSPSASIPEPTGLILCVLLVAGISRTSSALGMA